MGSSPVERARTLGSFVHPGRRSGGRGPSASGRCLSPGCEADVGPGGRFCARHEELLDGVRVELEGDDGDGGPRERFERFSMRGMRNEPPEGPDAGRASATRDDLS